MRGRGEDRREGEVRVCGRRRSEEKRRGRGEAERKGERGGPLLDGRRSCQAHEADSPATALGRRVAREVGREEERVGVVGPERPAVAHDALVVEEGGAGHE